MIKRTLCLLLTVCAAVPLAHAADATFNRDANASWNVATNWLPNVVPNGVGDNAALTNNITAARTITLDAAITVGHIVIGDSNTTHGFIVNDGTGGSLTLNTIGSVATITKLGSIAEVFNAATILKDDLLVDAAGQITLGGVHTNVGGAFGLTKLGGGLLIFTNRNFLGGATVVGGGILRIDTTNSISAGNWAITNGVLESANDIIRAAGSSAAQMQVPGGESGFSLNGGADRTVRFGAAASSITWGSAFFNPSIFILNQSNANRNMTYDNVVDMGGASRRIDVHGTGFIVTMNRTITNGLDFIKGKLGTLRLSASNSWSGATIVTGGTLRTYARGSLPPGNLRLYDGVIEVGKNTTEGSRPFGTGSGQIQLFGNSGWGAHEADRTILAGGNTNALVWGVGDFANVGALTLQGLNAAGLVRIANTLDLNGASRTVTVGSSYAVLGGGVTNSGSAASLVKSGGGTLMIEGGYGGDLVLNAGTLQLGDYWKTSSALPGGLGNAGSFPTTGGTIMLANTGDASVTNTISGSITGTGALTKNDRTLLVLTGTNSYTGTTTINRGTVLVDFSAAGAPASNIINAGSALTMGNTGFAQSELVVRAAPLATSRQTLRTITLNAVASRVVADGGADGIAQLSLSNITRNVGATLDFVTRGTGSLFTSSANTFGIIGGYATFNGSDWAISNTNLPVAAYTAYTEVVGAAIADGSNTNVRISGNVTLGSATTAVNTITMTNDGTAATISLAGQTLRLNTVGGLLVPPGAGPLSIGSVPNDGVLNAGLGNNVAGAVIIINNSTNTVVVNSAIDSNGTGASGLVNAGTGSVHFAGNMRAFGTTYINAGTVRFSGANVITGLIVNGGNLWLDAASTNTFGGTITVNAGSMTVDGPLSSVGGLDVGTVQGARAVLRISTNLTVSRLRSGANDNVRTASAIFQTGGTVNSATDGSGTTLADGFGNYGYYQLVGGVLTGNYTVTFRGVGVLDLNSGTIAPTNSSLIVNNTGWGILNVRGGSLLAPNIAGNQLRFSGTDAGNGTASLNIFGGTVDTATTTNSKALDLMTTAANTSYLNLLGGVLTANQIKVTSPIGTSVLELNGGTLAAANGTSLGTTFLQGLGATYIRTGGALINCNSNAITIGQALLAAPGFGLAAIPITTNFGAAYIGPPAVRISGGSGSGAQAIAELDFTSGSITNFRISSPGVGYAISDVLTVSLVGGGPLVPPTDFTVSGSNLAANTSGGLTKFGTGTLTLTNANSYDGVTVITNGVLAIRHDNALGTTTGNTLIHFNASVTTGAQLQIAGGITVAEPITIFGIGDRTPFNSALVIATAGGTNTTTGTITLTTTPGSARITGGGTGTVWNINGPVVRTVGNAALVLGAGGAGGVVNVNQTINNNGGGLTLHNGAGTIVLNTTNNIGDTQIQYLHLLKIGVSHALGTNKNLYIGVTATTPQPEQGTFDLAGFDQSINALNGNGTNASSPVTTRVITNSGVAQSTLTIGNGNGSGTFNGVIAGNLALTKVGTGTQTLLADCTHVGTTTIGSGILALVTNGSLASTSIIVSAGAILSATGRVDGTLTINANQKLSGNGTILGTVTNNGIVSPGASAGTLTITGNYAQAGSLDIELEAPSVNDSLLVTGTSTLGGTLNVSLINGYIPVGGDSFLFHQGIINGSFAATNLPVIPGLGWTIQYLPNAVLLSATGFPTGYIGYTLQITNATSRGITADPDADGYANLLEYVTGANPTNADQTAKINAITTTNGIFALRFNRNTNAVDATIYVESAESATNDTEWSTAANTFDGQWTGAPVTETGGPNPVEVTIENPSPFATNLFMRLRVTLP